jgi:hypothetical protein
MYKMHMQLQLQQPRHRSRARPAGALAPAPLPLPLALALALLACLAPRAQAAQTQGTARGYTWVESSGAGQGHTEACVGAGLTPTPASASVQWDGDALQAVVDSMGYAVDGGGGAYGLRGCCAPGLWCDNGQCFTQSFGEFANHGFLIGSSALPVYSCLVNATEVSDTAPVVTSALYVNGSVVIVGDNLGYDEGDVAFMAGGWSCYSPEACSQVCRSCRGSECGVGSACLSGHCYQYCAGLSDASCPCSTTCMEAPLSYGYTLIIPTFICSPAPIADKGCAALPYPSPTAQSTFKCNAPQLLFQPEGAVNVSVTTSQGGAVGAIAMAAPAQCETDDDCFDSDVCTVEVCSNSTHTCAYSAVPDCGSSPPPVREHRFASAYNTLAVTGMGTEQETFRQQLVQRGLLSSASIVDDTPHEALELGFNFSYFGSVYERVSLSPNGVLAFPPFQPCEIESYSSYDVRS